MKRIFQAQLSAALVFPLVLAVQTVPVSAADNWRDKAWRDMRMLAAEGAEEAGKVWTLRQVINTCKYMDNGYPASQILDYYLSVGVRSGSSQREIREMNTFSMALMAVAAVRLCPRHRRQVDRAIDF